MREENIIYGTRSVIEAIKSGKEIERLYIQKGLDNELTKELFRVIRDFDIAFQLVPLEKIRRTVDGNHQGVVAYLSTIAYYNIEEIITQQFEAKETPLILILDGITDVRNFGAIARTAECCNVNAIVIPSRGSALINADAIKTSAGALNKIPVCKVESLKELIYMLKQYGIQVIACTEKTSLLYTALDYTKPTAIIMGAEDKGVSSDLLKLVDEKAKLPLLGTIESLNVSVACGVMLYEVVRQRG